jgi:hypothetical protein
MSEGNGKEREMKAADKAKWNTAIELVDNLSGKIDNNEMHTAICNSLHLAPIMRADLWEAIKTESLIKAIGE